MKHEQLKAKLYRDSVASLSLNFFCDQALVKVAQLCPTLCNTMDCSPPVSSAHGILQARILDWVAIPFFGRFSCPRDQTWVSCTADSNYIKIPGGQYCNKTVTRFKTTYFKLGASLVAQMVTNLLQYSSIPGSGRSPGGGHGNPLQYSYQ